MTNTRNYSNQLKKLSSKITVLMCMKTSDSYDQRIFYRYRVKSITSKSFFSQNLEGLVD